jgi:hypothetical protein
VKVKPPSVELAELGALAASPVMAGRGVGVAVGTSVILGKGVGDTCGALGCGVGQAAASSGWTDSVCSASAPGAILQPVKAKAKVEVKIRAMTKSVLWLFIVTSQFI